MVNLKAILLVISFFLIFLPTIEMVFAGTLSWKLIGPGDADQVTSLSVIKDGDVFLGTDIGGLYHSNNQGEWWEPTNNGLKNY